MTPTLLDNRVVETFVALADTMVSDFDVVEFLSDLAQRIVDLGLATEVGILLADEDDNLQFLAASHERAHLLELFQVQNEQGPCRDAFTSGHPVDTVDLQDDVERWPLFAPRALATGYRSVQAVPLRLRSEVLGALNLFSETVGPVAPEVLTVVQALADVATISMLQQRQIERAHAIQGQLQHALHSRIGIEQAKGVVAEHTGRPMDEAFDLLRDHARQHSRKLADVAQDVVAGNLSADEFRTS